MVAVDYLFQEKIVDSQKEFCERIGITAPTLSRIKSNDTTVSDATLRKMNEVFEGRFNMAYFRGESTYYLLSDLMNAESKENGKKEQPTQNVDQSSLINATLAAKDETIASLRDRLMEKDQLIKTKDELIASLRRQLELVNGSHTPVHYPRTSEQIPIAAENINNQK